MKKIVSLALFFFSLSFFACRKEIVEPKNSKKSEEFIYLEIDNEKFLVSKRKLNFNKDTKGIINDQFTEVLENIHFGVEFENTELKQGQFKGSINVAFSKKTGIQTPKHLRLTLKCGKNNSKPIYQIYSDFEDYGLINEFKSFEFVLDNFDDEENLIGFQFKGSAFSIQDSLYHDIRIKTRTIFK